MCNKNTQQFIDKILYSEYISYMKITNTITTLLSCDIKASQNVESSKNKLELIGDIVLNAIAPWG